MYYRGPISDVEGGLSEHPRPSSKGNVPSPAKGEHLTRRSNDDLKLTPVLSSVGAYERK